MALEATRGGWRSDRCGLQAPWGPLSSPGGTGKGTACLALSLQDSVRKMHGRGKKVCPLGVSRSGSNPSGPELVMPCSFLRTAQ